MKVDIRHCDIKYCYSCEVDPIFVILRKFSPHQFTDSS